LTPEIDLAKGIAGQRGGAVIQYIQDFHRRRRERFEQAIFDDTGMAAGEIADLIAASEALAEVLENGWDAAERTASDYKIRLLARVVASRCHRQRCTRRRAPAAGGRRWSRTGYQAVGRRARLTPG